MGQEESEVATAAELSEEEAVAERCERRGGIRGHGGGGAERGSDGGARSR